MTLPLNQRHIKQAVVLYAVCVALHYVWLLWHGLLFSQYQPIFFVATPDVSKGILFFTGLQHTILHSRFLQALFDVMYILLPLLLCAAVYAQWRTTKILSVITALFVLVYGLLFSSVAYISIEGYVAFILLPFLFYDVAIINFYYRLHSLRYIFISIFFSAAVWKLRAGGLFNTGQMSGVLAMQHNALLAAEGSGWYKSFILYLINKPALSYCFYVAGFLAELIFVAGVFTVKFDRILLIAFVLFLIFDCVLMQINYFCWAPFGILLLFSNRTLPKQ
jgi:hypothetical protein